MVNTDFSNVCFAVDDSLFAPCYRPGEDQGLHWLFPLWSSSSCWWWHRWRTFFYCRVV